VKGMAQMSFARKSNPKRACRPSDPPGAGQWDGQLRGGSAGDQQCIKRNFVNSQSN
jgi:hypothetical protein